MYSIYVRKKGKTKLYVVFVCVRVVEYVWRS